MARPRRAQSRPDRRGGGLLLSAGHAAGTVRADAEARHVIVLIGWLSRLEDAELDARAPRLLSILVDDLRIHGP
ncbi:SbtR family transcriptional regulator [Nocardia testacea]|uniref:Transcriptional regulator SbtR-like C-terminal domain-containing protein n=1 Tax=Nocardia testacea TaxID=248551 RepID=A0ABW7VTA7_9NOCA